MSDSTTHIALMFIRQWLINRSLEVVIAYMKVGTWLYVNLVRKPAYRYIEFRRGEVNK